VEVAAARLMGEPVELREEMLALAAVAPGQVRSRLATEVAAIAADHLALEGQSEELARSLEAACKSHERELWLWLVGERRWQQCVEGLSGRLARRFGRPEVTTGLP
jgi:hypothetical protein